MNHQDSGELAKYGEPAQPNQRIQPHVARPVMEPGQTEHAANVTTAAVRK